MVIVVIVVVVVEATARSPASRTSISESVVVTTLSIRRSFGRHNRLQQRSVWVVCFSKGSCEGSLQFSVCNGFQVRRVGVKSRDAFSLIIFIATESRGVENVEWKKGGSNTERVRTTKKEEKIPLLFFFLPSQIWGVAS